MDRRVLKPEVRANLVHTPSPFMLDCRSLAVRQRSLAQHRSDSILGHDATHLRTEPQFRAPCALACRAPCALGHVLQNVCRVPYTRTSLTGPGTTYVITTRDCTSAITAVAPRSPRKGRKAPRRANTHRRTPGGFTRIPKPLITRLALHHQDSLCFCGSILVAGYLQSWLAAHRVRNIL